MEESRRITDRQSHHTSATDCPHRATARTTKKSMWPGTNYEDDCPLGLGRMQCKCARRLIARISRPHLQLATHTEAYKPLRLAKSYLVLMPPAERNSAHDRLLTSFMCRANKRSETFPTALHEQLRMFSCICMYVDNLRSLAFIPTIKLGNTPRELNAPFRILRFRSSVSTPRDLSCLQIPTAKA